MHTLLHEFGLPCFKSHQAHCYWRSQPPSRCSKSMLYWDIALLGHGEKMKPDSICDSLHCGYISKLKTAYCPWEANWGWVGEIFSTFPATLTPPPPNKTNTLNSLINVNYVQVSIPIWIDATIQHMKLFLWLAVWAPVCKLLPQMLSVSISPLP